MLEAKHFYYDATFEGLLTAVFKVFEYMLSTVILSKSTAAQEHLFLEAETVITDLEQSSRVWDGLCKKLSKNGTRMLYHAFLSEIEHSDQLILEFCIAIFQGKAIEFDVAHPITSQLLKIKKKVSRERHRMTAFVRFRLTKDQIYFASIEPDFNVLPLISSHFKKRYADQEWLIYDVKRHYGISYNLKEVSVVDFEFHNQLDVFKTSTDFFALEEIEFQTLWQSYFKSVTIASRKNLKLHTQHVPKRYWKYLSEKQQ